jgi:hypothetical protein
VIATDQNAFNFLAFFPERLPRFWCKLRLMHIFIIFIIYHHCYYYLSIHHPTLFATTGRRYFPGLLIARSGASQTSLPLCGSPGIHRLKRLGVNVKGFRDRNPIVSCLPANHSRFNGLYQP